MCHSGMNSLRSAVPVVEYQETWVPSTITGNDVQMHLIRASDQVPLPLLSTHSCTTSGSVVENPSVRANGGSRPKGTSVAY